MCDLMFACVATIHPEGHMNQWGSWLVQQASVLSK